MLTALILHLHLAAFPPIDNLRLCGYEARQMFKDEDQGDDGERVLQNWLGGFLPPKDHCGKRVIGSSDENDPRIGDDAPFTPLAGRGNRRGDL